MAPCEYVCDWLYAHYMAYNGRLHWDQFERFIYDKVFTQNTTSKTEKAKAVVKPKTESVWFCHTYQRPEGCNKDAPHSGRIGTQIRSLLHICATCWLKEKIKRPHPECSMECPNKDSWPDTEQKLTISMIQEDDNPHNKSITEIIPDGDVKTSSGQPNIMNQSIKNNLSQEIYAIRKKMEMVTVARTTEFKSTTLTQQNPCTNGSQSASMPQNLLIRTWTYQIKLWIRDSLHSLSLWKQQTILLKTFYWCTRLLNLAYLTDLAAGSQWQVTGIFHYSESYFKTMMT